MAEATQEELVAEHDHVQYKYIVRTLENNEAALSKLLTESPHFFLKPACEGIRYHVRSTVSLWIVTDYLGLFDPLNKGPFARQFIK